MAWYKSMQDQEGPFPQREETMNLDVIHPRDALRGRVWNYTDEDRSLTTSDIRRCRAGAFKYQLPGTKTPYYGDRARTIYPPRASQENRPTDLSLTTKDITGATPGLLQDKKLTTNRVVNPLQPDYRFAASEMEDPAPPQPRFGARVTNHISDIEMTSSKKAIPSRNNVCNVLDVSDIDGAAPRKRTHVRAPYQYEDYGGPTVTSCRPINPLDPQYPHRHGGATSIEANWTEETNALGCNRSAGQPLQPVSGASRPSSRSPDYQSHSIGPVHGSKPKKVHQDNGAPQLSLFTQDIEGAVPQRHVGRMPIHAYGPPPAKPCFHDPADVQGAKADSLTRGIEWSSRNTNPLEPTYPEVRGSTHKHHPNCEIIEGERGHIMGRPAMNRPASLVRNTGGHKRRQC